MGLNLSSVAVEYDSDTSKGEVMRGRFVYVFSQEDRKKLLSMGLELIKSDETQHVYVFVGNDNLNFSDDIAFVFSDTLTF